MSTADKPARNWQRILLVASLAVNLCVIGAFVGILLSGGSDSRVQRFDLGTGPLTRAMDDDRRSAVRDDLRQSGAFRAEDRASMRRDIAALLGALRAEEFDEDTFRTVLTRQRDRLQDGQAAVVEAVAGQIADMSVQERADFADRLEQQFRRAPQQRSERSGG